MNVTSDMEKAMHAAHGVGYALYCQSLEVRMQVERRRTQDHLESIQTVNEYGKSIWK